LGGLQRTKTHLAARQSKNAPCGAFLVYLAEWTGLEPATPGVTGRYSNQLNYHSTVLRIDLRQIEGAHSNQIHPDSPSDISKVGARETA
jgi:hypothetical protein